LIDFLWVQIYECTYQIIKTNYVISHQSYVKIDQLTVEVCKEMVRVQGVRKWKNYDNVALIGAVILVLVKCY
jgi:hypothetical protein